MTTQAPRAVVLIRPHHFTPNPHTAADNAFQTRAFQTRAFQTRAFQTRAFQTRAFQRAFEDGSFERSAPGGVASAAFEASTRLARALADEGVTVHVFEDITNERPDSVFPNNWFSTHAGGRVALFPMYAPNRRLERRPDVIDFLKRHYRVAEVVDYSGLEEDGLFLEGTGAMVLDHVARVAYTARSRRADPLLLERFCTSFGYEPMSFDAVDSGGTPIYHTNVMMCIATKFAIVGLTAIEDSRRRAEVVERLEDGGRTVIALDQRQLTDFAGNAIELRGRDGRVLALSTRAAASLTPAQREVIEASARLLPVDVSAIEHAGGSVRCMIAGIHLSPRVPAVPAAPVHQPTRMISPVRAPSMDLT